ncbi:response regulator [Ideonella sp. YS5]|uniref:response regulator n=1 Tax=Ideonella sp. YS5 TaxID=3453714 RepID=UPI003EED816F
MTTDHSASELRVLVIDDNLDGAVSFGYLLQVIGCRTSTAFGGEMGLRVAQLFQPVLVFIDLHMPGPDGCEVVTQLREMGGSLSKAICVCLTATGHLDEEPRCLAAGFDRFLQKPLEPAALADLIQLARDRQGLADAAAAASLPSEGPLDEETG